MISERVAESLIAWRQSNKADDDCWPARQRLGPGDVDHAKRRVRRDFGSDQQRRAKAEPSNESFANEKPERRGRARICAGMNVEDTVKMRPGPLNEEEEEGLLPPELPEVPAYKK